jgi:octopine/nopaline transport system ATP-binding protein
VICVTAQDESAVIHEGLNVAIFAAEVAQLDFIQLAPLRWRRPMIVSSSFLARSFASVAASAWSAAAPVDSEGVIDLTVADPDLSTPELIIDRAVAALRAGDTRYTETAGRPHLRRAIAERHAHLSGRPTAADNVLLAPGAQCALYLAVRSLAGPGDHLVAIEPYYVNYPATLAATGAEVGFIRTDPDREFCVTQEGIAAAIKPKTKAIVFSNPNNPSGRRLRHDEMLALANVALERDLWLISDEIYDDLSYRDPWRPVQYGDFVSLASSGLIDDRLVVLGSLSKSHAMTGWRMGWMIAPQSLVAQATVLADIVFHGLPGFVQEAASAAILDKTTPERAVEIYRRRRDAFAAGLGQGRAPIAIMPEAGPFILCDIRGTGLSGSRFAELALLDAGVGLVDGGRFGRSTQGFVRAALTRPEDVLVKAGRRLGALFHRFEGARSMGEGAARAAPGGRPDPELAHCRSVPVGVANI